MLVCGFEDSVSRDAVFAQHRAASRTFYCFSVVSYRGVAAALTSGDLVIYRVAGHRARCLTLLTRSSHDYVDIVS